jgi:hypothetical protein
MQCWKERLHSIRSYSNLYFLSAEALLPSLHQVHQGFLAPCSRSVPWSQSLSMILQDRVCQIWHELSSSHHSPVQINQSARSYIAEFGK